jgi:DNA-binding SARP family transcriptional activator
MNKIQVKLFGTTTVLLPDGSAVTDLGGIKPRQVLEILALSVGTPVSKDRLVEHLWGDNPPRTYTATLESYISLLRRRMGVSKGRQSPLATTSNGYVLDPAFVEVDVDTFRQLAQPTLGATPQEVVAATEKAISLVTADLLASEPYADWAAHERTLFQSEYMHACNRAASAALAHARPEVGVEMARRAVACDDMSETSWQLLIRSLAATGARSEALRAYLDLRRTLVDALGTEPSAASRSLYMDLLAEDDAESTPASSVQEVRTLLALLEDALESFPDVNLSLNDRRPRRAVAALPRRTTAQVAPGPDAGRPGPRSDRGTSPLGGPSSDHPPRDRPPGHRRRGPHGDAASARRRKPFHTDHQPRGRLRAHRQCRQAVRRPFPRLRARRPRRGGGDSRGTVPPRRHRRRGRAGRTARVASGAGRVSV